jgi:hypothetical protein
MPVPRNGKTEEPNHKLEALSFSCLHPHDAGGGGITFLMNPDTGHCFGRGHVWCRSGRLYGSNDDGCNRVSGVDRRLWINRYIDVLCIRVCMKYKSSQLCR